MMKTPQVNWIGLWTLIRRECARVLQSPVQAFVAPWISALMLIYIVGYVVGGRMPPIGGHSYLEFIVPGMVMMNVISVSFNQASSQVHFSRFQHYIEESLMAPFSYAEMIVGVLGVVILRAAIAATGILLVAAIFNVGTVSDLPAFALWILSVSVIFGFLGIIVGLWARTFEQLGLVGTFFVAPLSYVAGVFNTTEMLPHGFRALSHFNPLFYFVNGLREAMIGFRESTMATGVILVLALMMILSVTVWRLYAVGWGIRE